MSKEKRVQLPFLLHVDFKVYFFAFHFNTGFLRNDFSKALYYCLLSGKYIFFERECVGNLAKHNPSLFTL